jgi:hypothetical protein
MADELTGTQTGTEPAANTEHTTPDPQAGNGTPVGRTYTDSDLAAARRAEARKAEAAQAKADAAEAELAKYREADEARKREAMTEADRLKAERDEAVAKATTAEATAEARRIEAARATYVAENAADLPPAYRRMVTGSTEEEFVTSLAASRAEFDAVKAGLAVPPAGPPSIGVPSAAPGTQPSPPEPLKVGEIPTPEQWAAERARRGWRPMRAKPLQ